MDLLHNLGIGFGVAFTFQNLAYAFFGAMLGTLIGVLPESVRWRRSRCCCRRPTRSTRRRR